MQHEWMIDVLSDLKTFAQNHKLEKLAEHLDDAVILAASEMVRADGQGTLSADELENGGVLRTAGAGSIY